MLLAITRAAILFVFKILQLYVNKGVFFSLKACGFLIYAVFFFTLTQNVWNYTVVHMYYFFSLKKIRNNKLCAVLG